LSEFKKNAVRGAAEIRNAVAAIDSAALVEGGFTIV